MNLNLTYRTGIGLDFHAFLPSSGQVNIYICGVPIPHDHIISAHSDGDVALHALTDAMLGAIAAGSIGQHFPPSEPQWKGAKSEIFVKHALKLLHDQKAEINNIDLTIICELPKIMPHAKIMQEKLSNILGIYKSQVNIKAVTTEKLGFLGRREGIAAQAICTITLPTPKHL